MPSEKKVEAQFQQLIKEYDDDKCSLELLMFLARHPHTRFSRLAITHALNSWRLDMERALRILKDKGLIKSDAQNGTSFYSLSEDEKLTKPVMDLVQMDGFERQPVLRELYSDENIRRD